jgi:hypothetical protein
MAQAASQYPTIAEELHRKTVNAIVTLLEKREREEISEWEYYIAIQALFEAVSGLVPEDVFELLSMDEPPQ